MPRPALLLLAAALSGDHAFAMAPPVAPVALSCHLQVQALDRTHTRLLFQLRNDGPHALRLLRWGSPFENAWFAPFVRVTGAHGDLPYQGAMKKRGEPSAADYLHLRPGETVSAQLRLEDAFGTVEPGEGGLVIRAQWRWHDVLPAAPARAPRPRAQHQGLDQACGEVRFQR